MGLKDLFGGGKKKEAVREEAKELAKGRLTPGKAEELAALVKSADVDLADDKTRMRRSIFNKAVSGAKARGKLTDAEAAELAKIQKFLALRDDQVEKTRFDVTRLRTLTEIRHGRLPAVAAGNVALRGAQLRPGEVAHYCIGVDLFDAPGTGGHLGVPVRWATAYAPNAARAHAVPVAAAKPLGEGTLILTNRRLYLRAGKDAAVDYAPEANFFLYSDGLRIERTIGHTILRFKSQSDGTAEIVGELLAALMR